MATCVALVGVVTALGATFSELRAPLWAVAGLTAVVAVLTGVRVHRPGHRWPWGMLAAALLALTAGDAYHNAQLTYSPGPDAFPSPSDACHLAVYPLLATALFGLVRYRWADHDLPGTLDTLIVTVGLALPAWVYLMEPLARPEGLTWPQEAVRILYALGDVLVLALLVRLLAPRPGSRRNRSVHLLVLGTLTLLCFDVAYGAHRIAGHGEAAAPLGVGGIVFCTAYGLAALHPSMVELTASEPRSPSLPPPWRQLLPAGATLIAPAVLAHEALEGDVHEVRVVAAFSALLFLLVILRLGAMVTAHREIVVRERELRTASAALRAAAWPQDIARACDAAVGALLGPKVPHATVLLPARDSVVLHPLLRPAGTANRGGAQSAGPRGDGPAGPARCLDVMVPVPALGPVLAERLGGLPMALLCPLVQPEQPPGGELPDLLVAAGPERRLTEIRDSLGILASHAGLATERLALRNEIIRNENEAYFRTLVHNASDVILIVNEDTTVRYASPSARAVFGRADLTGTRLRELVDPPDRGQVGRTLAALDEDGRQEVHDHWWVTPTPQDAERVEHIEVEVRCRDLRHDTTVAGLVVTLRDVTEQRRLEYELTQRAFHDPLTGLPNRTLLLERAERALMRARRDPAVTCLLFIDLDDFKNVNDTLGHSVGDRLLCVVGERLSRMLRRSDTAARLGGDEFAVLMEDVKQSLDAELLAAQVIQTLSQPFQLSGDLVNVSASVGVATARDSTDAHELLGLADLALYAAKAAGKRQWRRFRPQQRIRRVERHELQARLNEAVSRGQFTLRYQPVVDLATGDVAGFEALVRWRHSRYGLVSPDQFIPLAEETGQISPLGAWVLHHAAADIARLRHISRASAAPYVSVNVSAHQWRGAEFLGEVCGALDAAGLAPGALLLEITESVLMQRDRELDRLVREMKDLGVRIAVDDFGSGFSSLRYLREFPVDVLKIDKTFVDDIAYNTRQVALVQGIVHLADTLGLEVIAEGIEEPAQQELLAGIGCRFGQGYLFATPMTVEQGEEVLRRRGGDGRPEGSGAWPCPTEEL
ncbi:EAL domain-containing protein [Streptomyces actuosus]|uniref:EAL domain-containing protein n=1 Tax=Streptomyces actuosus TaxID=1885 RepID=A0ABS2VYM8_STRAS|nr:EAL domain-containing protein [Streptomyces actuosus]MBN0048234.1 EAL domain-containing protein [Streptomyces actuosus]